MAISGKMCQFSNGVFKFLSNFSQQKLKLVKFTFVQTFNHSELLHGASCAWAESV